jgi:hypothetical protein
LTISLKCCIMGTTNKGGLDMTTFHCIVTTDWTNRRMVWIDRVTKEVVKTRRMTDAEIAYYEASR